MSPSPLPEPPDPNLARVARAKLDLQLALEIHARKILLALPYTFEETATAAVTVVCARHQVTITVQPIGTEAEEPHRGLWYSPNELLIAKSLHDGPLQGVAIARALGRKVVEGDIDTRLKYLIGNLLEREILFKLSGEGYSLENPEK